MSRVPPFLAIAPFLLLTACAHPHVVQSYDQLRAALAAGDYVEVTTSAQRVPGVMAAASADSLRLDVGGARREIPRTAILRVERLERLWRRSTLIGLGVGAGAGAAIAGFSDCPGGEIISCGTTRAVGVAATALVGAGIGAAAGAKRRVTLIYVAPARQNP